MNTLIREVTGEAAEIIRNINIAARNMEITAQQKDEELFDWQERADIGGG